jgi:hypothetical protein
MLKQSTIPSSVKTPDAVIFIDRGKDGSGVKASDLKTKGKLVITSQRRYVSRFSIRTRSKIAGEGRSRNNIDQRQGSAEACKEKYDGISS